MILFRNFDTGEDESLVTSKFMFKCKNCGSLHDIDIDCPWCEVFEEVK